MKPLTFLASLAVLAAAPLAAQGVELPAPTPIDQGEWVDTAELQFGDGAGRRTLTYELEVTERGRARTCRIVESSGDSVFDKSACGELRKNARFERAATGVFQSGSRYFRGLFYADPPVRGRL